MPARVEARHAALSLAAPLLFFASAVHVAAQAPAASAPDGTNAPVEEPPSAEATAASPDVERAQQLYEAASSDYEREGYDAAIEKLREAHGLYASTIFLFDIAQAQRKAGRCSEARKTYVEFLEAENEPELRARATIGLERLSECRPRLDATALPLPLDPSRDDAVDERSPPPAATPREPRQARRGMRWSMAVTGALAVATAVCGGMLAGSMRELRAVERSVPADPQDVAAAERRAHRRARGLDVLGAASVLGLGVSVGFTFRSLRARSKAASSAKTSSFPAPASLGLRPLVF